VAISSLYVSTVLVHYSTKQTKVLMNLLQDLSTAILVSLFILAMYVCFIMDMNN
jgi:hypothetical protein